MTLSSTCYIALVVVQREDGRFLLVDEKKDRGWYLPAGRVERGESLLEGAMREALEETGIEVELTGILRFEHTPETMGTARLRVIFVGRATGGVLKTEPDSESMGAGWFTVEELKRLRLRATEVIAHCSEVSAGRAIHPISILTHEGAPYP